MKKIMFGLVLLAAVAVQAASITWGVSNTAFTLPSGSSYANRQGVTIYLIDAASQASIIEAIGGGTFSASTAGVLASKATTNTKGYIAANEITSAALTAGTSYNFAALILDTVDGDAYYNISAALNESAYTAGVDETMKIAFGATQFNGGTGWTKAAGGGDVGTPEPTSALLLVVGGAMLALRRKQK